MNQKETIIGHVGVAVNIKKWDKGQLRKVQKHVRDFIVNESSLTRHDKCFIAI